ncbi:D-sedoheptulose-7-phosphate isomerase [Candidatus Pelagibacter sp. HIMB1542]|uniref:D-sedoheptulose-7-phosphate isomerase n=1 Tax=Candidatus Pelagibacter sp. HIMB1542 TaxID=3413346 RepID=UPI003F850C90
MSISKKLNITLKKSVNAKKSLTKQIIAINDIIHCMADCIKMGNKMFICGNGGSAADAQHIAAECLVRLKPNNNRKPIPMISLALDSSTMTACANDYSYNNIFSRNLEGLGKSGDVLICISTSGNSGNILKVLKTAKKLKIKTISILGNNGGKAKKLSDKYIIINSSNVASIQEAHIFLGHFLIGELEKRILN